MNETICENCGEKVEPDEETGFWLHTESELYSCESRYASVNGTDRWGNDR